MSDNKNKRGGSDRTHINIHEDYELRDWSKKFNVTPDQLKAAVAAVGAVAKDVEVHLNSVARQRAV